MSAIFVTQTYAALSDLSRIDIPRNLDLALSTKRHIFSILREILSLWRGRGQLRPQEYFYYRLWDPAISPEEKRRFVGKRVQNAMHLACNSRYWYCASADKLLFHTIAAGASLPIPELIAFSAEGRMVPGVPNLTSITALSALLRQLEFYPVFMKAVGGKYSLSVVSADHYDQVTDEVLLLDGSRLSPNSLAEKLITPRGYLVQRRLRQAPFLAVLFGPRLWSVRPAQLEQIASGYPTRERFLTELTLYPPDATSDQAGVPLLDEDYLNLSTIHSAKGQEWKSVFVLNVVDGCMPSDLGTGESLEIEEERRLLYVAMTRAKDELHLMLAQRFFTHGHNRLGDRHVCAARSRFIPSALLNLFQSVT